MEWLADLGDIAAAILALIGSLKILARYTKWEWDDKAFAAAEKPVKLLVNFLQKKDK
jgi:hypothetical protein